MPGLVKIPGDRQKSSGQEKKNPFPVYNYRSKSRSHYPRCAQDLKAQ